MDFRTVAKALAPYIKDSSELLYAVDDVLRVHPVRDDLPAPVGQAFVPGENRYEFTHEALVRAALGDEEVLGHMRDQKKINAIKALRTLTGCGLREAKDACEDQRVYDATGYTPWAGF